jgi:hypothetical protein
VLLVVWSVSVCPTYARTIGLPPVTWTVMAVPLMVVMTPASVKLPLLPRTGGGLPAAKAGVAVATSTTNTSKAIVNFFIVSFSCV